MRISLVEVGRWIRSLGRVDPSIAFGPATRKFPERGGTLDKEIESLSTDWLERRGRHGSKDRKMTALKQAALLGVTPVREGIMAAGDETVDWGAPMRLDADDPIWIA